VKANPQTSGWSAATLRGKRRLAMLLRTVSALHREPRAYTVPPLAATNLPPMLGRVEILRDRNGVPHIYACEEPDLYATLGYLQGADRFVLLDIVRHLGAGRMTELVGDIAAPAGSDIFSGKRISDLDGFIRPLDFEAQSRRDLLRLSPRARACIEAFAQGVNAALSAMAGIYPPEYLLLGRIRPWNPADALLAARTCAFCVSLNPFDVELTFDAVRGVLDDEAARRFFPEAPWEHAPSEYRGDALSEPEAPLHLSAGGSNNWAISAGRSASGAPIFANDPHVPVIPLPTFWYHAHLECPRYRVQGGLMLGCPVFGFGHNGFLAWGCTTAYRDAWDLYRIHRLPNDPGRYCTVSGSGVITRHREWQRTRFGRELILEWERCEHGVIYPGWRHHDGTDLAVRLVPSDLAHYFEGYMELAEAQTVEQHQQALAKINDGPFDFNHVYAHRDGHIGWEPFGQVPRRTTDGLFVRDADDPSAQWAGYVPFAEMPKILDPPCGYVASANSVVDAHAVRLTTTVVHVEPRFRQARIESFLASTSQHTWETCASLQRDVGSDYGAPVRDALVACLAPAATAIDRYSRGRAALADWPGVFTCDSAGASVFVFTLHELTRCVFLPLLGAEIGRRYLSSRRARYRLQLLLCDPGDPLRHDVERAAGQSLQSLIRSAFTTAVDRLCRQYGEEPAKWAWGRVQRVRLGTPLAELPFVGRYFTALDEPFPGDIYTVSPCVSMPSPTGLRLFVGATSRFICDLARPEEAWFSHSSGPSAAVGSAFSDNLSAPWHRFEYFRSVLWPADAVPDVVERIVVEPQRA
jgi:penicillin amidase